MLIIFFVKTPLEPYNSFVSQLPLSSYYNSSEEVDRLMIMKYFFFDKGRPNEMEKDRQFPLFVIRILIFCLEINEKCCEKKDN